MAKNNRIFICPKNDLESVAIVDYLKRNGEFVLVTEQTWGANWDNLESNILDKIRENCEMIKCGVRYGDESFSESIMSRKMYDKLSNIPKSADMEIVGEGIRMPPDFSSVYAIELGGRSPLPAENNIDHHNENADRPASIEQVAEIVGVPLNLEEKFIAANDSGYIPAMEQLGRSYLMTTEDTQEMIGHIRLMDRQCQGITLEQENSAQRVVNALDISGRKDLIVIEDFEHSKCATLTDRLYGKYDNLLICSQDGEINFYGDSRIVQNLADEFGGWHGQGFWGATGVDANAIIVTVMEQTIQLVDSEEFEYSHVKGAELLKDTIDETMIKDSIDEVNEFEL